jgi:hypothetical protein
MGNPREKESTVNVMAIEAAARPPGGPLSEAQEPVLPPEHYPAMTGRPPILLDLLPFSLTPRCLETAHG